MTHSVPWPQILVSQLWSVPNLVVFTIGIAVSLVYVTRYPTPAMLSLIAFILMFVSSVSGVALNVWLVGFRDRGMPISTVGTMMGVASFLRSLANSGAMVLLLLAVFTGRASPTDQSPVKL